MISNRPRRRISEQQLEILTRLLEGSLPAFKLADDLYSRSDLLHDAKRRTKSAKRALRGLERWQLVRLSMAPHPDADMTFGDYLELERSLKRNRVPTNSSIFHLREACDGRIAPSGNRKQATLWAEVTDLGREYLRTISQ